MLVNSFSAVKFTLNARTIYKNVSSKILYIRVKFPENMVSLAAILNINTVRVVTAPLEDHKSTIFVDL